MAVVRVPVLAIRFVNTGYFCRTKKVYIFISIYDAVFGILYSADYAIILSRR